MHSPIRNITIVGAGFMGRQIAVQAALHGCSVRLYDSSAAALADARREVTALVEASYGFGLVQGQAADTLERISYHDNLQVGAAGADLALEAVPENIDLKRSVFSLLDTLIPDDAILATNSSSIPVSRLEDAVKRKERIMNIHFYAPVSKNNFVDLMGGRSTGAGVIDRATGWIHSIGCVPLHVMKECMGFVFNRVWHAVKRECLASWAGGHADYRDIDRAWMIFTGMMTGPFAMMDVVGLDVVYDIEMEYFRDSGDPKDEPPAMLREMIDRGDLGLKTGRGFYDWKDPEFARPGFINREK